MEAESQKTFHFPKTLSDIIPSDFYRELLLQWRQWWQQTETPT